MKNWRILTNVLLLVAIGSWLLSCGPEEEVIEEPIFGNVEVVPGEDADGIVFVDSGEDVVFTVDATTAGGFNVARLLYNGTIVDEQTRTDLGVTAGTVTVNDIVLTLPNVTESGVATIQIVDDAGQDQSVEYAIEVLDTDEFSAVLLGGFLNPNEGSFYNSIENIVYIRNEAEANDDLVDLLFYYANTPGYTLAAPDNEAAQITWDEQASSAWPLATENNTRFKTTTLNSADFDDISTATEVENAFPETGAAETRITGLQEGQVIAFQLDESRGGRFGLIEVVETAGASGSGRTLTIDVKIQRE